MTPGLVLYQIAGWLGLPLAAPVLAWKALVDSRYREGWRERFGGWGRCPHGGVWLHGASVGELRAAEPLARRLRKRGPPLVVSATSPSGRRAAQELAGDRGVGRLLPLDLLPLVRRALKTARPRVLVLVETELWPALLHGVRAAGVPAVLVSARISDRAFPRYRRIRRWLGPMLEGFEAIQAQSDLDADRFRALGAPPGRVRAGGNLKFDLAEPDPADQATTALRRCGVEGWHVVVAGSTHQGEEAAVVAACNRLGEAGRKVALVLAPRHLERLEEAESAVRASGRAPVRWSRMGSLPERGLLEAFARGDVVMVDGYGLLGRLYGGASCAFVGGTLVPVGGHNLLEPLNWGVPVVFGPHTDNARQVRDEVLARALGTEATNLEALADAFDGYLSDPDRVARVGVGCRDLFAANRGAADRAVEVLEAVGVLGEEA